MPNDIAETREKFRQAYEGCAPSHVNQFRTPGSESLHEKFLELEKLLNQTPLPNCERIALYDYKPGDVLVVKCPPGAIRNREQAETLAMGVKQAFGDGVKVVVLHDGIDLECFRPTGSK